MQPLNRVETFALGVAGSALTVSLLGVSRLVVLGILVAAFSYGWRKLVASGTTVK